MTNEVDAIQQAEAQSGDSCADAIAAVATVFLFVATVIFWLSNQ
ncbi:hypothetical protein [Porticoccus sp.]